MEYALTADHHRVHALDAEKGQEYYCPVCGNQVIPRQGEVNSWHFAHVTSCVDDWKYDMSEWHRNWQNRFPESTREVVIEDSDEAYYWNVASYCVEGNLQAVLDEYAFTLGGGSDLELLRQMKSGFVDTASIQIETRESFLGHREKSRLRTHFAVGYFNAQVNEKTMQRTENIRSAFNSPFRPFVLATTSIGQEGLDFHNYCRKIMHWNLPSNPIDLEQREGRINRYLCHAIRQNLADSEFGAFPFEKSVWKETMDRATVALKQNHSDLIPYWCLPDDFPFKYKIERIVPMYPYSQDRCRYDHLMDVLSVYRLTLGQPRQEELFETIHKENWNMDELKKLYINLSPWNRAHHNGGTEHED